MNTHSKHNFFIALIQLLCIASLMNSCTQDSGPYFVIKEEPVDTNDTMPVHYISYNEQIQSLWNKSCVSCHNQDHPMLDLRPGYSRDELLMTGLHAPYVDTIFPFQSLLLKRLNGSIEPTMPLAQDQLSSALQDSIFLWIRQGCRDN